MDIKQETRKDGFVRVKVSGNFISKYGILIAFLMLFAVMGILRPSTFLTVGNQLNILRQVSINGIMAIGMTFVIITGGTDLSVGSMLAFASIVACSFAHPNEYLVFVPIIVALLIGALLGLFNGIVIAKGKVAPFIATLGTMTIARGMTQLFNGGRPINDLSTQFNFIGGGSVIGIPVPVIVFCVIVLLGWFLLNKTRFGRYVYAIGGNETTAKVSGIRVNSIYIMVYTLMGVLSALSGIVLSARVETATVIAGTGYELDAIAAVIIGGTSTSGGRGTIIGTIIGVLTMGVLSNGLDLLGVSSYYQQIVKGFIIIGAVLLDKKNKA
ncbi:ribose/xylose/arabinose/galactoside ABC-type transport system permease subunit [Aequitasia blattaphilus]|uniref:Ribose ABC transporter permease n=1 Tax=Aequitasia blattaphilus TaxID=2949332 RepID=A0ABT1EG96_9FIRM|nr:ribose ABC transporter permease [Aequitasia blattaphilus]MCP1103492.1 ribose ABC transporter permease [Aequitasia blattaphilus]MCR8616132.1 ribose ABC transporter permease [Aequitasia blattaphilus]